MPTASTKRTRAIGSAVIAVLIVTALVWLTRGGDAPTNNGTGGSGQSAKTGQPGLPATAAS